MLFRSIGFEVKTDKGRTTTLQEVQLRNINRAGGTAVVVRSLEDVKNILNETEE